MANSIERSPKLLVCDDCDKPAQVVTRRVWLFKFDYIPQRIADKGIIDLLALCQWCLSKDSWSLVEVGLVNYEGREPT